MTQNIIDYYKDEHKHMKKPKRDLGLQKKMAKHYALKNKLTSAKLKEALIEIQALKGGKDQVNLGILPQYFLQASQT